MKKKLVGLILLFLIGFTLINPVIEENTLSIIGEVEGSNTIILDANTNKNAIGIIGGADGPTAIFLASKTNKSSKYSLIIAGVICSLVALFMLKRKSM